MSCYGKLLNLFLLRFIKILSEFQPKKTILCPLCERLFRTKFETSCHLIRQHSIDPTGFYDDFFKNPLKYASAARVEGEIRETMQKIRLYFFIF